MRRTIRRWSPYLLGLLAFAYIMVLTQVGGVGVSPDSTNYLSAADEIALGRLPKGVSGEHLSVFPPLFPALVAIGSLLNSDSVQVARIINALALGATVLLWSRWAVSTLRSPLTQTSTLLLAVGGPLLAVSLWVWTEPLFLLLMTVQVLALLKYLDDGRRDAWLLSAAALALAFLSRYAGIALVLAAVPLLVALSSLPLRRRLFMTLGYAGIAITPCALWMALNAYLTGSPMGARPPAGYPAHVNIVLTGYTTVNWFSPFYGSLTANLRPWRITTAALICLVLGTWIVHLIASARQYSRRDGPIPFRANPLPFLWVTAVYLGFTLVSSSMTAVDAMGDRLLSPTYPLLVAALVLHLDHALVDSTGERSRRWPQTFALCLLSFLLIAIPVRLTYIGLDWAINESHSVWGDEDPGQMRKEISASGIQSRPYVVYSNDPYRLYYIAGIRSIISPCKHPYRSPQTPTDHVPRLFQVITQSPWPVKLVWFHDVCRDYLMSREELAEHFMLVPSYSGVTLTVYDVAIAGQYEEATPCRGK